MSKPTKLTPDIIAEIERDSSWDDGRLGRDIKHAKLAKEHIDSKLALKLISCRLQESLINDLKHIAASKGLTYQPLMRQILTEYVSNYYTNQNRSA